MELDGALLHYGDPLHYSIFDYVCIASAVIVPLFALVGPITAWRKRDLGAGGRRPEPAVSALAGNASWLLFGWTEALVEPLGLNLWGGGCQMPGLLVFLWLCTPAERRRALRGPILVAVIYLALLSGFGVSHHIHLGLYQFLCTAAGVVAAAAPIFTFFVLLETEEAMAQFLPHWIILAPSVIHALLWCARGVILSNHYMLFQNLAGLVGSASQLSIKFFFSQFADMYGGGDDFFEEEELLVHLPVIPPPLMPDRVELPPMRPERIQDPLVQKEKEDDDDGKKEAKDEEEDKQDDDDKSEEEKDDKSEKKDDDHGDDPPGGGVNSASNERSPSPGLDSAGGQNVPGERQPPAPKDATSSGTPGVSSGKDVPPCTRRSSRLALASKKTPSKPTMVASNKTPSKPTPTMVASKNKTPSKPTPTMVASNKTPSKPTPTMVASNKTPSKLTMALRSSTTRNTPTSGSESSSTTANIPSGSGRKRQR